MQNLNIVHTISVRWWNACAYYAVIISKGIRQLDYTIQILSDYNSPPYKHAVENNLDTIAFNFASLQPFNFIKNYFSIKSKLKKEKVNVVNCHRPEDHLIMGIICKHLKIPLVRTVGDIRPPAENIFNKWLHLKATDFFIFTSQSNQTRFASVWPEILDKSTIILGGLNLGLFEQTRKSNKLLTKLNLNPQDKIVGYIGRLSKTKDLPTFIRTASLIKDELPQIKFLISGKEFSVTKDDLKKKINALNLSDSVYFLDKHDPVSEVIGLIDIGIICSKDSEAISRIGMEYIAMGKPVVATDVNVLPEIVENGINGFITNTEDPHSMAKAAINLLKDENLYKKIVENNFRISKEKFDYKIAAAKTVEVYQNLLKTK